MAARDVLVRPCVACGAVCRAFHAAEQREAYRDAQLVCRSADCMRAWEERKKRTCCRCGRRALPEETFIDRHLGLITYTCHDCCG